MHKRLQRLKRYSAQEIDDIRKTAQSLRSAQSTVREDGGVSTETYISVFGFAPQVLRNLFLRSLRVSLAPRILHASYIDKNDILSQRFEAVLVVSIPPGVYDELEVFVQQWRLSAGVIDLDTNMSRPMVTAIQRISNGRSVYGNWNTNRSQGARTLWFHNMRLVLDNEAREHVLAETGRVFSTGNMLAMHYDLQNSELMRRQALATLEVLYTDVMVLRNAVGDLSNAGTQLRSAMSDNSAAASTSARTHAMAVCELATFVLNVVNTATTRGMLTDTVRDILGMDLQDRIRNLELTLQLRVAQTPFTQAPTEGRDGSMHRPRVDRHIDSPPSPPRGPLLQGTDARPYEGPPRPNAEEDGNGTPRPVAPSPAPPPPRWSIVPVPVQLRGAGIAAGAINTGGADNAAQTGAVSSLMLSFANAVLDLQHHTQHTDGGGARVVRQGRGRSRTPTANARARSNSVQPIPGATDYVEID